MNKELEIQIELTDILCFIQDAYFYLLYDGKQDVPYNLNKTDIISNLKQAMDIIYELIPIMKGVSVWITIPNY